MISPPLPDPAASGHGAAAPPPPPDGRPPLDLTADGTSPKGVPQATFRGHAMRRVLLPDGLDIGRDGKNDLILDDQSVSRRHARIERTPLGFQISDLQSRGGTLVNGRRFAARRLVIGDQIQVGPFFLRFDGTGLERTTGLTGVEIIARHVTKTAGTLTILDDVSLEVSRGQFAAILGPSGSGKSSLLDTMTGLRPGQGGQILVDGVDFYRHYDELRSVLGYVPQDDIVHTELTVIQALRFAAQLRLPPGTPPAEIEALIVQTIEQLGLTKRTHTRIARLSGGQRKRVSVGVELLGGPLVLFLDEPTSGLDPASEFKMMALLRDLASGGRTIICTTHVMENVYLTDRIFVLASGHLIFAGGSAEAKAHFGVEALAELYDLLDDDAVAKWQAKFTAKPPPAPATPAHPHTGPTRRGGASLLTLLHRQATILASDWKNFLILFVQPMVIALLVGWVASEPRISAVTPTSLAMFFAYLSTLWFGCSNAAQEIVRELPIYRREHMVGLGRHSYLLSKFLFLGAVTGLQCLFLYVCLWAALQVGGETLRGSLGWQLAALLGTALAGVGIGFAISAFCRTTMQAVMVVPMILIPQILFSGFVVPAHEMTDAVWTPARVMPSYAAQTLVDQSVFWGQRLASEDHKDTANAKAGEVYLYSYQPTYYNLEFQLNPAIKRPEGSLFSESQVPKQFRLKNEDGVRPVYLFAGPGLWAVAKLLGWTLLGYATAFFALRTKERG